MHHEAIHTFQDLLYVAEATGLTAPPSADEQQQLEEIFDHLCKAVDGSFSGEAVIQAMPLWAIWRKLERAQHLERPEAPFPSVEITPENSLHGKKGWSFVCSQVVMRLLDAISECTVAERRAASFHRLGLAMPNLADAGNNSLLYHEDLEMQVRREHAVFKPGQE